MACFCLANVCVDLLLQGLGQKGVAAARKAELELKLASCLKCDFAVVNEEKIQQLLRQQSD